MPPVDVQQLSPSQAYLLGLIFPSIYVGSLYISKNARLSFNSTSKATTRGPRFRESNERWRDDPEVIRARIVAVSFATLLCCLMVWIVVWQVVYRGEAQTFLEAGTYSWTLMGMPSLNYWSYLTPAGIWNMLTPHLLAPLLFLGPLYAQYLFWSHPRTTWSLKGHLWRTYANLIGLRNYVVAPITEEVVFRACVLAIYHLGSISHLRMIWLGPLNFGLAHVHHAWDVYNRFGRTSEALKRAVLTTLFQLTYTTLFGAFCTFIFLRTASLAPIISAHIFCNFMGVPDVSGDLRIGTQFGRKFVVVIAYIVGAVGFGFAIGPWTTASAENSFLWRK